jgi:putative addiction module CopG family antidote
MAYALAKENEAFIERMLKLGRYNNQSEVVREALRRMEREEKSYLNPPPLTEEQLREVYGSDQKPTARNVSRAAPPSNQSEGQRRSTGALTICDRWEIWTFHPGYGDHPAVIVSAPDRAS